MDDGVFSRMEADELALGCMVLDEAAGQLMYSSQDWLNLGEFLAQCPFKKEDGFLFASQLLQNCLKVSRNKPVLFSMESIFVSPYGDAFRFVCLPLSLQHWIFQAEEFRQWILDLAKHLKTKDSYELSGFLYQAAGHPDFSLPSLLSSLEACRQQRKPKGLLRFLPERKSFRLKEPVSARWMPVNYGDSDFEQDPYGGEDFGFAFDASDENDAFGGLELMEPQDSWNGFEMASAGFDAFEPQSPAGPQGDSSPSRNFGPPSSERVDAPSAAAASPSSAAGRQKTVFPQRNRSSRASHLEAAQFLDLEKTQVMFQDKGHHACLQICGESYELAFDSITIGRHIANDIVLNDGSVYSQHARIIKDQGQFYLQDLNSTNGTFAHGKQLLRETMLENGMTIAFGKVEAVFYE